MITSGMKSPAVFLIVGVCIAFVAGAPKSDENDEHSIRVKRNTITPAKNWPDGLVHYFLDTPITNAAPIKQAIADAMKYISDRSCVRFVENATVADRIKFVKHPNNKGVYGSIGMIGGEQTITLDDTFGSKVDVVIQQLIFALGFTSHNARSDRETFINIAQADIDKLPAEYKPYFTKLADTANDLIVPYEYGSVLHLGPPNLQNFGYSINFTAKNALYQNAMGTAKTSFFDMAGVNLNYCNAKCMNAISAPCGSGGYPNPNNCSVCICPTGFAGAWCLKRQEGFGANLTATTNWQTQDVSFVGSPTDTSVRSKFDEGTYLIMAPRMASIEVMITNMGDLQCHQGCKTSGVEIKLDDWRPSGIRICCSNMNNKIFASALNPLPVLVYNRFGETKFTFQYRALGGESA